MSLFTKIIRKLFLVKEIVAKNGQVRFRRFRLLQTPWRAVYIHQIMGSDLDADMHDHPFDFSSVILEGAYQEQTSYAPDFVGSQFKTYYSGDVIVHKAEDVHKLTLISGEVWTLVFTSGRDRDWGYRLRDGSWVPHKTYRQLKNEGKLR